MEIFQYNKIFITLYAYKQEIGVKGENTPELKHNVMKLWRWR
jgi:hypothetical protein